MSSLEHLQNGRYALIKKLGEGGKGIVYKARDTTLNRVVAIKMLKSTVSGEDAFSRFMREAQTVAKLNHPNIVSIYDIGKEDDKQFFVLEFVDGMSLRELMKTYPEGKCDLQTILRISTDVCNALQYAHSQGVLHRDIKPENILITEEGISKLMDFGLARMLGQPSITQEGIIVGTVAYVAPENALGKGADARSDLYSFGAVLYEMVTGKPPFVGEDPVKVIFSHIHDYPVSPSRLDSKVPQVLADCIMRLLEKEPGKRYQNAAALLQVLRSIGEDFPRETLMPSHKPSVVVPSPRPSALKEVQLIDRIEEMTLLKEAVDRTVRGEGGLVFLYGEAGIGKTRLARELGAYARLRGMQVLYGRCPALFRMDGVPPYVIWNEVIKDYLQICTPEQLYKVIGYYPGEVCKLVPEVKQKLGTIPQSLPISPEHERDRLFEAVSQLVTNISKEAPLLVVLDDLQWTDQSSLLLLHYLARGVQKEPLLLLGDYRDTDIDDRHPLTPVLTELNRERLLQSVQLKRMSFEDISEMIRQILEQDDVQAEFCQLVYEKTKGNPFFAEEVIKSLKEEEVIYREGNKWKIKEVSQIEFPKTVKSVIKARISRLDDDCQNVLTLASFVGKDFTFEALRGITGVEEDKLLELLEKMLKTGLIKEKLIRGEDVYSFADIIVRDVVHEEVSLLRHKKLHGIVGCALEKVYAENVDQHLGELAYHFLEGGDKKKALDYFLKAGEKAQKIYANAEAISYFQSALRLLDEKEGAYREKAHVFETLGDIKKIVGEYDLCLKRWNEALMLWKQLDEKEKAARLHRKMANVLYDAIGDVEKAKEHQDKALSILEAEPESVELAALYAARADMSCFTEDVVKACSWAEKALELAKKLNAFEVIANSYIALGDVFRAEGERKEAVECMEKALKIALDNGYVDIALRAYNDLAVFLPTGEDERSLDCHEKGLELAKKAGNIESVSWYEGQLAIQYFFMGNSGKALTFAEESEVLSRKIGNLSNLSVSTMILGATYHVLGEWNKGEQYLKEALSISLRINNTQSISFSYRYLGWFYYEKGEYAQAKEYYEKMSEIDEKRGKALQMSGYPWIAMNFIELGEIDKARILLDDMRKFAHEKQDKQLIADEDATRAMLFRAEKKWSESIGLFEKSLQEYEASGARQWNVYRLAKNILYEYARVYLERDQPGDREKAHNLLNQAMEIFQKVDAKKDIEKIIAKKKLLTA